MATGDYTRICGRPSPDGKHEIEPMDARQRARNVNRLSHQVVIEPRRDVLEFADLMPWRREQYARDRSVTIKIGAHLEQLRRGRRHVLETAIVPPTGLQVTREQGLLALDTLGEYLQEQDPSNPSFPHGWPEPAVAQRAKRLAKKIDLEDGPEDADGTEPADANDAPAPTGDTDLIITDKRRRKTRRTVT